MAPLILKKVRTTNVFGERAEIRDSAFIHAGHARVIEVPVSSEPFRTPTAHRECRQPCDTGGCQPQALRSRCRAVQDSWDDYAERPLPEADTARHLIERLLEVRRALRQDLHAAPPHARNIDRIRILDSNPSLFCVVFRAEAGESPTVTVPLTLDESFQVRPACTICSTACSHGLSATDELLDWLFNEAHDRRDEVIEAAGRAPWRRWLDTLDGALEQLETDTVKRAAARLWWDVDLKAQSITPFVEHGAKKGGFLKPKRIRVDEVETQVHLTPEDRNAFTAVQLQRLQRTQAARDGGQQALFLQTVAGLIGHPRVSVGTPGGSPWTIEQVQVSFTVEQTDEALDIVVMAGDQRLSPEDIVSGRRLTQTLLFEVPEQHTLRIARIDPQLSALLQRWANDAVPVPAEAQTELMQRLSRASQHVAVQTAGLLKDVTMDARLDIIALLCPIPKGGLFIEFKIRPLPNGPLFRPGMGPEEVLSVTADRQILRTRRDLREEQLAAAEVLTELDLWGDDDDPDRLGITDLAQALNAVQRLRDDPRVECQWPERPWYPPMPVGTEQLHISVRKKRDWFGVHGCVKVQGQRVELAVLIEASRQAEGYVALNEGRFIKLETALRTRLQELEVHLQIKKTSLRITAAGAKPLRLLADEAYSYQADQAWTGLMERMDSSADFNPSPPAHLRSVLRPYQAEGFVWMSRLAAWGAGAVLADDMGLGKTIQAIAVMCTRAELGPQLVVAPTSVCFNWTRELARFGPELNVRIYAGSGRERHLDGLGPGDVLICSYGILHRDAPLLKALSLSTLVLDEAQAIKNPKAQRSVAVRSLNAAWRVALTGTPVENHPSELWSLFEAVFPGLLGTWESFRVRFLATVDETQAAFGTGALSTVIRPYVLRRKKSEVARDLPPRTEITVDVTLSERERALYEDARLVMIASLKKLEITDQNHVHFKVLAALTRLRQLACHPRLQDPKSRVPSSKLERLMQLVNDLVSEGRRGLIFSQFTKHLALVREALDARSIPYAYLDGSTPVKGRIEQVDRFQTGDLALFLVSLKAGGTGLNLTAADTVIHLDPWWNPAVEDQATDRAHRIGQTQPVTVMRLVTRDTIEHQMLEVHADKREMVRNLLDGTSQTAQLSSADLMALIRA